MIPEDHKSQRHNSIQESFFTELSRAITAPATGDLDPSQHPLTKRGIFIAGWFVPVPPTASFMDGWHSEQQYSDAECDAMAERWELEDQQNVFAIRGAYDDQADTQPDGYTAEDLRLELVNAAMDAEQS